MNRVILAAILGGLIVTPAVALDAKVKEAIKTFGDVGSDPAKLKAYCDMGELMEEAGDDEKKLEAADAKIEAHFDTLGPEFETAWNAGENLKEDSEDAKALSAALDELDQKCFGDEDGDDKADDAGDGQG